MKIDAIGIISSNILKTIEFYKLLGVYFEESKNTDENVESIRQEGDPRLIIGVGFGVGKDLFRH